MLKYHTEIVKGHQLLTVEFEGNQEQRAHIRENIAKTILPSWQFLSYLDCRNKGSMTFFVRK